LWLGLIFYIHSQKLGSAACDEMENERSQGKNQKNVDEAPENMEEKTTAEDQNQNNC
jgi:hypothetical protein